MMPFHRGDVVLVLFSDSNLQTAKRRPALVVQADGLGTGLPQTIVAMITSNLVRATHPSRIVVKISSVTGRASGLLSDSVIMTDNLATVLDSEIDRVIGILSDMTQIDSALRTTLGL
jgi:mRNA interferase MazF